jgi:hypothetical protein
MLAGSEIAGESSLDRADSSSFSEFSCSCSFSVISASFSGAFSSGSSSSDKGSFGEEVSAACSS